MVLEMLGTALTFFMYRPLILVVAFCSLGIAISGRLPTRVCTGRLYPQNCTAFMPTKTGGSLVSMALKVTLKRFSFYGIVQGHGCFVATLILFTR